jgi:2-dehydro-3-deoxyphosphogalactonate aldolase
MVHEDFNRYFRAMPLIAILRGVKPEEVVAIGEVVIEAGIRILEVPLNSPCPFESIRRLAEHASGRALVGAGTVLTCAEVDDVAAAKGDLVVSPNMDARVIERTRGHHLLSLPGVFTPTEALSALAAGADALKLFPGELATAQSAKAMAALLPPSTRLILVGGVTANTIGSWLDSGVHGFGVGSSLYKPGFTAAEVRERALAFAKAVQKGVAKA